MKINALKCVPGVKLVAIGKALIESQLSPVLEAWSWGQKNPKNCAFVKDAIKRYYGNFMVFILDMGPLGFFDGPALHFSVMLQSKK